MKPTKAVNPMKKIKYLSFLASAFALALAFPFNALAESTSEEANVGSSGNETLMLIIAAVFLILAVVSVVLVNKRTKKYRQAFKKRKKKK